MQRFTRVFFRLLVAMMLVLGACSKSVEGESRKWDANTARVTELSALYPGFKPAIAARQEAAKKVHEAAGSLEGEQKISKLSEANEALMKGFVRDLDAIDEKMKKLRESRVEAAAQAGDQATQLGAKVAAEDAQKALDRVEAALKAGAADEAGAAAVLKKLHNDLDTAQSAVDKVVKVDKAKKDEAAASKKAETNAKADADAAAAAKVAPWKCTYCGNENPHDESSCKSCGAPRQSEAKAESKAAK